MSMHYIRRTYGVQAKRGARVEFSGWPHVGPVRGTIVAATDGHLIVRFDGKSYTSRLHPTWLVRYLESPGAPSSEACKAGGAA